MNDYINNIFSEYEDELNVIYGSSEYDLEIRPEGTFDSHSIYCRFQEPTVGNLLADAFKAAGNSEIGFINGGGVRSNLNKGNLTRSQIMEVAPFFNNLIVKEVPGKCILDALEFGVSKHPSASGAFPQVSGIKFDIDTSLNSTVETDSQGIFRNVTRKRKVSNVKINGEDIDPNKNYTISMSDYIGNGGDGFSMFTKYDVILEGIYTDTDSIAYFIKNDLNGTAEYKDFQGRTNFVNGSSSSSVPGAEEPSNNNSNFFRFHQRKSSQGLSTGGILAIIIPTVVALIAAGITAMICTRKNAVAHPELNSYNSNVELKA